MKTRLQLADELLDHEYRFQSFFEQTAVLAEKHDEAMRQRIEFKASTAFLERLGEYAEQVEANRFAALDIRLGQRIIPDTFIAECFARHPGVALTERLRRVLNEIETAIRVHYRYEITPEERRTLRDALKGMHRSATLRQTYKAFYDWLGQPELFQHVKGKLEYADVFPLVYLKMRLEGLENPYREIKHLLIPPRVIRCRTRPAEFDAIREEISAFRSGVVVCSAHMAKGPEFDRVLVPGVTAAAYAPPMDRNLLHVACTRAMHGLVLTHTGKPSGFLPSE